VGAGVKICAIIKADAYGHGVGHVLDALTGSQRSGSGSPVTSGSAVDALAVASIDEAQSLPSTPLPVLIFRPIENVYLGCQREKLEAAIRSGWVLTVTTAAAVDDVARIAVTIGKRAVLQIMLDTGMTRSGTSPESLCDLIASIDAKPSLKLWGICTHFASSEEPDNTFTGEQLARYRAAVAPLVARRPSRLTRHAANSGAIFFHPGTHLDMVRPGISLYGIDPTGRPNINRKLRPVMKWTAPIVEILNVPAGANVGYNQSWTASRASRIALVPVGYADGYLRCFSNRATVVLHDRGVPVAGRVSMDLTTLDITDVPQARAGDEVTLLDSDPLSPASVYRLAELADTIPYEIFCRIGSRIKRVAVDVEENPEIEHGEGVGEAFLE